MQLHNKIQTHHIPPALLIPLAEVEQDAQFKCSGNGARKIGVTTLYSDSEKSVDSDCWKGNCGENKCPVLLTDNIEIAFFNNQAPQDLHYHKISTEIYMVVKGKMKITVDEKEYRLQQGDTIIVQPGAVHQVRQSEQFFICRVVSCNCTGKSDKYLF